jgi:hypothetical protein
VATTNTQKESPTFLEWGSFCALDWQKSLQINKLKKQNYGVFILGKLVFLTTAGLILAAMVGCSSSNTAAPASDASTNSQSSQAAQQSNQQRPRMASFGNNKALLTLLKIDSDTLKQEFKAGKSLADIAAEKKVPEQQVIDLMVKESTQRIDQSVKSGKLTQEKADQMKAKLKDQITKSVERKGGFGFGGRRAGQGQHQNGAGQDDVSSNYQN